MVTMTSEASALREHPLDLVEGAEHALSGDAAPAKGGIVVEESDDPQARRLARFSREAATRAVRLRR